jgi:hypothetical protein
MPDNPFIKNFDSLLLNIQEDINNGESSLYINDESIDSMFSRLLVQSLKREINGQEVKFLAIRDVTLKENFRGKKLFTNFFTELNKLNIDLMFHDIINDRFYKFLIKQQYQVFKEIKNGEELTSCYKLKK